MSSTPQCSHFKKKSSRKFDFSIYVDGYNFKYIGEKNSQIQEEYSKSKLHQVVNQLQSHQNVVTYLTTCKCNPMDIAIITEYWEGDLETCIREKCIIPLTLTHFGKRSSKKDQQDFFEKICLDLLQQTTQGLRYLHENDIIHCDVRPSNVFLFKYSKNKIVAKLGGLTHSKKLKAGSHVSITSKAIKINGQAAMYIAPECWSDKCWSKSSDVFALGILMYNTLSIGKHPFGEVSSISKIKSNIQKNAKPKFTDLRSRQNMCNGFEKEKWITVIDMIKRMIKHASKERFTVEDVLFHPTFYNSQKKLDFLLKIHESVKNFSKTNFFSTQDKNNPLLEYNAELEDGDQIGKKEFYIDPEKIFEHHQYFLEGDDGTKKDGINPNDKFGRPYWNTLESMITIQYLLKSLRNTVAHACDDPPRVPEKFKENFRKSEDSYKPQAFLNVFLSSCPQLLVHLYEDYRGRKGLADDYYSS